MGSRSCTNVCSSKGTAYGSASWVYGRHAAPIILALAVSMFGLNCTDEANPLASYEGHRPLTFLKITENFNPDVQWVGGFVAAVGINRGERAALDSTLVWMVRAEDNDISSHITVNASGDNAAVEEYGGTPVQQLVSDETYTIWLATKEALDAGLSAGDVTPLTFADTTMTMELKLLGIQRGAADVELAISKNETLLDGMQYLIDWAPADFAFRRIALNRDAAAPSFQGVVWHVVLPDEVPDQIVPPIVLGDVPAGTLEAAEWPGAFESGEGAVNYVLWIVNSDWDGSFAGLRPPGMASFIIQRRNFQ